MLIKVHQRAFTLIEMVVAMAIVGITLMAGIPIFKSWSQNMQVRASAESALNGLQYARAEALRRNSNVRFQLTTTLDSSCSLSSGQTNWVVNLGDSSATYDAAGHCGDTITPGVNIYSGAAASPFLLTRSDVTSTNQNVSVASTGTAASMLVVFGPLGQVTYPTSDTTFVFSNPSGGACATSTASGVTCMNLVVSVNGRIRMCNPILPATSPQGC